MTRYAIASILFASMWPFTTASATQDVYGYFAVCAPELGIMRVATTTLPNPDFEENAEVAAKKYGVFGLQHEFSCNIVNRQYTFQANSNEDPDVLRVVVRKGQDVLFEFPFFRQAEGVSFLVDHVVDINRYVSSYCWYDGVKESGCEEKLSDSGRPVSTQSRNDALERARVGEAVEKLKLDAERN
ncbi:MAG: hypothetical protein AAFX08_00570 [Pseudomonadota bacterium]